MVFQQFNLFKEKNARENVMMGLTHVQNKSKEEAEKIVEALRKCPYSKDAAIIGEVTEDQPGKVVMTTEIGTQALLPQPGGELLPRIC